MAMPLSATSGYLLRSTQSPTARAWCYRRSRVPVVARAAYAMGRRRRRRRYNNIQKIYEESTAQQLQERQLDDEEQQLLSKQVYITCISRSASESVVQSEFAALYGGLQQVRMINKDSKTPGSALLQLNYGPGQQQKTPLPRAVLEFQSPSYAAAVLSARQEVPIVSFRDNKRTEQKQFVLPAGRVGHLKRSCNCRPRHRCCCPGYAKASRNQPTRNQSYQRGGAGGHTMQATGLQIGSFGADGVTFIPELDVAASCMVEINLHQRMLTVEGPLLAGDATKYRLESRFRHLRHSLAIDQQQRTLMFTVKQPPKVLRPYRSECGRCQTQFPSSDRDPLHELCGDPTAQKHYGMIGQLCSRCQSHGFTATADEGRGTVGEGIAGSDGLLGRCLTYKLRLDRYAVDELFSDSNKLLKKLRSFKILKSLQPHPLQQQSPRQDLYSIPWHHQHDEVAVEALTSLGGMLQPLQFDVGYHVLVLLSSGVASPWQVCTPTFHQALQDAQQDNVDLTCRALAELSAYNTSVKDLAAVFSDQLQGIKADELSREPGIQPSSAALCKILRVHVTPTRVKFLLPEVQTGNRVVRNFCAPEAGSRRFISRLRCLNQLQFNSSHFLRVSFGDEQGDRVFVNREESMEAFFNRMLYVLETGVCVNGRKYSFLAYSSSQLRAWSTWMVADPGQDSPEAVGADVIAGALRHWLGDAMETEKVAAKCAARLGQGFSATVDAAEVQDQQMGTTNDVERVDYFSGSTHCFSDGVGRISPDLLDNVLDAVPFAAPDGPQISAIQVRFRGCKGVLSRYSPLQGQQVQLQLRPSMEKFGSDHPRLEVCSVAAWLPAYLNRQVIIMMDHNGVEPRVVLDKLDSVLDQLAEMCCSTKAALTLLPSLGGIEPGAQDAVLRMLHVSRSCGLPMDALTDACLKAVARWQVTDLRQKARLLVPKGATLVGVMDEFDVLEEDEVFVQVQLPARGLPAVGAPRIITGCVMLAKHPVAHRGDVRRVTAVDPLSRFRGQLLVDNYVNVVVFSQRGARPLPNKLSGSDLDGDQYMVLWDMDLLQPSNSPPMDYTAHPPDRVDRVEVLHLQQHFVNHAKNDNLGRISTWLLAHADANGADCAACEKLAQLHSTAVDFPKTGRPAVTDLTPIPDSYPHWMEKTDRDTYTSSKVLGQMYDRVLQHPIIRQLEQDSAAGNKENRIAPAHSWPAKLLQVPGIIDGCRQQLQQAEANYIEFESDMVGLMNHWEVYDVGEMVTGCLRRLQRSQGQRHQQSEQRDQINREIRAVFSKARRRFLLDLLQLTGPLESQEALARKTIKALETAVYLKLGDYKYSSTAGDNMRLQLAAAYMVVANKWAIKQQRRAGKQHRISAAPAAPTRLQSIINSSPVASHDQDLDAGLSGTDDEGSGEEDAAVVDDEWMSDDEDANQASQGSNKSQEVQRLVRLCFQWIVARELQELAALI